MTSIPTRLAPPQLQVLLGTPGDHGSIHGLALAGSTLLATHYGSSGWGQLHVLDPQTLERVADPLPLGHQPRAVAWHPGRRVAFVMNRGVESYSLSQCHLETGEVVNVPIGFGIIALAVDPAADLVYVADWSHRRLIVLDAGDPARRRIIPLPEPPVRLAVAPEGDVIVALSLQSVEPPVDALAIVRPDGSVHVAPISPAHLRPGPVAIGHDGMVYLGSLGGGSVHPLAGVHDPDSGERLGSVRTAAGARDLAAHPHLSRAWAATDRGAQMIDATNPYQPRTLEAIATGRNPYGVAVGDDGTVYVGDNLDGTVSLIEPDLTDVPLEAVSTLLTEAGYSSTAGLGRAIRSYQAFYGLPQTGRPDTTTVDHLTAPGCGNPDLTAARPSFNLLGGHYRHTDLTYYLGSMHMPNGHPDLTDELKEELIRVSFDEWNKILAGDWVRPLDLTRVDDPAQADIVFSVGDNSAFHGTGWFRTVYAVTDFPAAATWPRERAQVPVVFNEEIAWGAPGYIDEVDVMVARTDFRHVATHELGHTLGFDHSGKRRSVMYRNATWYRVPKADDQEGMRAMYGKLPFTSVVGMQALPGQSQVACQDCEQHLLVHYPVGDDWAHTRLNAEAGAPLMAKGRGPSAFLAHDGVPSYVYRGVDDHVEQLWFSDGAWWWADLSAESGGAPPMVTGPHAYRNGDTQRVVYGATDGRVIRLSQAPGQGWQWQDVSQPGAGFPLDTPFGYVDEALGLDVIAYRDGEEGARILQEGPGGWSHISLTWATQHENPTPLDSPPRGMAGAGEEHRLFCLDHRQDIRMFYWGADGAWHTRSLTAELGLPPAKALAMLRLPGTAGELAWVLVFSDFDGRLWDLKSSGGGWTTELIQTDGIPPAGRHGVSVWLSETERHVAYTSVNGNVQLLSRSISDAADSWRRRNLTRAAGVI